MRSPYEDTTSKEGMTSSIKVIARAQNLSANTISALEMVIQYMNNPKDPVTIDEAIESAMMDVPTATRDDLYPAYEALYQYLNAKKSLASAIDDGDVKTILHLLQSFGKLEGYKPDKEDSEQKEIEITILQQY